VSKYSLEGQLIEEFESLSAAARSIVNRKLNYSIITIGLCCKGRYEKAFGFKWQWIGSKVDPL
jgi:hypothetical protein